VTEGILDAAIAYIQKPPALGPGRIRATSDLLSVRHRDEHALLVPRIDESTEDARIASEPSPAGKGKGALMGGCPREQARQQWGSTVGVREMPRSRCGDVGEAPSFGVDVWFSSTVGEMTAQCCGWAFLSGMPRLSGVRHSHYSIVIVDYGV